MHAFEGLLTLKRLGSSCLFVMAENVAQDWQVQPVELE